MAAALTVLLLAAPAAAQEERTGTMTAGVASFRLSRVAANLRYPWALAFLPDGRMLVSERTGRMLMLDRSGRRTPLAGILPVAAAGQGGLLDIALHPDFARNGLVYWTFSEPGTGGAGTALAAGKLSGDRIEGARTLWSMTKKTRESVHFGSRIRFGADGKLYLTTGDRGDRTRARDPSHAAGKVIRLNDDGSVPQDNPFVGKPGYLPEIFSMGHRNAQGLAVRPGEGTLWLTEHGPRGGDEVNLVVPGGDYGWPLATYGREYSGAAISDRPTAPGIREPHLHWTPSIAPSGLDFYSGDAFPTWKGHLLSGSLAGRKLVLVRLEGARATREETLLDGQIGRIRDVRTGPDGLVYLLTDDAEGELWKIEPVQNRG
jgi:glucose/arabinose dehydrogenase